VFSYIQCMKVGVLACARPYLGHLRFTDGVGAGERTKQLHHVCLSLHGGEWCSGRDKLCMPCMNGAVGEISCVCHV